jgi:5-methyltetrahydropteroyltriglutamate--homocysteine methyltransferase
MLDVVEDKEGFRQLLDTLDVPAFAISNPTCVGEIRLRESLAVEELHYLRTRTDRPIRVTLPGPYPVRQLVLEYATRRAGDVVSPGGRSWDSASSTHAPMRSRHRRRSASASTRR